MKITSALLIIASLTALAASKPRKQMPLSQKTVAESLVQLGEKRPEHYVEQMTPEMVERGRDLIFYGKTEHPPEGEKSRSISKFYQCTSCHNTVREDETLTEVNTEERLEYALQRDLPYLQGSTFWGIVNRETWYNDDYVLKYGALVEPAKNSLKGSIQLCAEVCSQGRTLEDWEMESILAYFWSLQMTLEDIGYTPKTALNLEGMMKEEAAADIRSKFLSKSPATFGKLPKSKEEGYSYDGRPEKGQFIYENGCQHCHNTGGESDVILDDFGSTFKWLERNITANSDLSIYQIIRKGTYAAEGHREYMPHYTEEKLSDRQLEDLRSYIELKAAE